MEIIYHNGVIIKVERKMVVRSTHDYKYEKMETYY